MSRRAAPKANTVAHSAEVYISRRAAPKANTVAHSAEVYINRRAVPKANTAALCLACAAWLAGCGTTPDTPPRRGADEAKPSATVSPDQAFAVVKPGTSTAQQVKAALGETTEVRFDSGYQVWVYRFALQEDKDKAKDKDKVERRGEFIVLLDPKGLVTKTRLRVPPAKPTALAKD